MKPWRIVCMLALMAQFAAPFTCAQETSVNRTQDASKSAPQERQGGTDETQKRLERLACASSGVHFSHRTDASPQVLPGQPADKGLIYVIRSVRGGLQSKLAMDGKWMGVNRGANYFYFEAEPGPHYFCSKSGWEKPALLSLVVEKSKTYYLHQSYTIGGMELNLLDEEQGKQYVAKFHRSVFEVKPKK